MANARIARFISEAAPPQFVSVMRQRSKKVLDTIKEEERDFCGSIGEISHSASASKAISSAGFSSSSSSLSSNFLKEAQHRAFSIFNH